jgi:hypothetical protein
MGEQLCLLLNRLEGHAPHVFVQGGDPDCARVTRIVLVAAGAFLDPLRRQQLDLVAPFAELTAPVVCAAASLHHDTAGLQARKEIHELAALQLSAVISPVPGSTQCS